MLFSINRFGSDELRREFLAPCIAGDVVSCLGVSEQGQVLMLQISIKQLVTLGMTES